MPVMHDEFWKQRVGLESRGQDFTLFWASRNPALFAPATLARLNNQWEQTRNTQSRDQRQRHFDTLRYPQKYMRLQTNYNRFSAFSQTDPGRNVQTQPSGNQFSQSCHFPPAPQQAPQQQQPLAAPSQEMMPCLSQPSLSSGFVEKPRKLAPLPGGHLKSNNALPTPKYSW